MNTHAPHTHSSSKANKKCMQRIIVACISVAIVLAGFFIIRNEIIKSTGAITDRKAERIIRRMSNAIMLPQYERPVIVTLQDVDRLRTLQPFYKHAQDGHYGVFFQQNALAFIYDLDNDRIINVGNFEISTNTSVGVPHDADPARVEIRVHTSRQDDVEEIRSLLRLSPLFEVASVRAYEDFDRQGMTVLHQGDDATFEAAQQLAEFFGAEFVETSSLESSADIVIIFP